MKVLTIIKYVFTGIGIAMLVGAFFLYRNTHQFLATAVTAQGTVVELVRSKSSDSTTYRPVVVFNDRNNRPVEFVSSAGSNPPSYARGERVEVLYSPDAPQDAKINGFFSLWGAAVIVGGIGAVFFLIGGVMALIALRSTRTAEHLRSQGVPISTEFQRVERNEGLAVNGEHPFRVVTQWLNPATGEMHVFRSENLWYDPTDQIKSPRITVLIERDNPKRYLVDLSFLPKLAQ